MAPSIHAPEVVLNSGLEVPYEGIEPNRGEPKYLSESASKSQKEASSIPDIILQHGKWKKPIVVIGLIVAVVALVVAVTVGTVIGIRQSRKRRLVVSERWERFRV